MIAGEDGAGGCFDEVGDVVELGGGGAVAVAGEVGCDAGDGDGGYNCSGDDVDVVGTGEGLVLC